MHVARFESHPSRRSLLLGCAWTLLLALAPAAALAQDEPSSPNRSTLIAAFAEDFTGGTVPLSEATGEIREFTLEVHAVRNEIAPGVEVDQWAFAFPGEEPSVPGPEIRVTQGDLVRITLRNTHDQPHSIHPHGIIANAAEMDGVDATSHVMVMPGHEFTYEFVATGAGTHAYHCHVQTYQHLDMGMYGSLIVEPRDAEEVVWDHEFGMILDEWDTTQDPSSGRHAPEPDYFLINGRAFPATEPIDIPEGELGLIRVTHMGYAPHTLHLHGMSFLVLAKDGYDLPQPYRGDTLPILPGERYDILVKGRDGVFPIHDHVVSAVANAGVYPGGMLTLITGGEARRTSDDPESVHFGREAVPTPMADQAPAPSGGGHAHDAAGAASAHDHADPAAHDMHGSARDSRPMHVVAPADEILSGDVNVAIRAFAFDRPVVTVRRGTTITWTNEDAAPHTVTAGLPGQDAADRAFDSTGEADGAMEMMNQGDAWSFTFDEVGEFDYYCLPHPFMTAKVVVVD